MQKKPTFYLFGVYGTEQTSFFQELEKLQVDTFCDIRLRRGMRGKKYAYVNSSYLQNKLAAMSIAYIHFKELAPNQDIRQLQQAADKKGNMKKSEREVLSRDFILAYEQTCLHDFDGSRFVQSLGQQAERVVLFCVEKKARACHRSLLGERLRINGFTVEEIEM